MSEEKDAQQTNNNDDPLLFADEDGDEFSFADESEKDAQQTNNNDDPFLFADEDDEEFSYPIYGKALQTDIESLLLHRGEAGKIKTGGIGSAERDAGYQVLLCLFNRCGHGRH